ncbi:MAG: porin, partial [Myxococcota bacterium]
PQAPEIPKTSPSVEAPQVPLTEPNLVTARQVPSEPSYRRIWGNATDRFRFTVDGFMRLQLSCIYPNSFCGIDTPSDEDARRNPFVGRNDLFGLGGARVNLRGDYGDSLYVKVSLDGSGSTFDSPDDPVGRFETSFRDIYFGYQLGGGLTLYAGRFKPPFDTEALTAVENLFFVNRSLESRGVRREEGWSNDQFNGFAPGRQLGVMLTGDHAVGGEDVRLSYQVALTNGSSGDLSLNDNDFPALYGRVALRLRGEKDKFEGYRRADEEGPASYLVTDGLQIGLGGFVNEITTGLPPNRFNDRIFGGSLDVAAKYSYFIFQGQILAQQVQHLTRGDTADERGLGGHAQISFDVLGSGFYPGYRFAILDPREPIDETAVIETADSDRVVHHTIGLKWISKTLPLMGFLEYTVALEQEGRELPNDRVEAAVQVIFE